MTRPFSISQIDSLGERLRKSTAPSQSDLVQLQELCESYLAPMTQAQETARRLKLRSTSRIKTTGTLIQKLVRDKTRLSRVQDIAGIRIVRRMTLTEQDEVVSRLADSFSDVRIVDRRQKPSHGYRAVHVIANIEDCLVEIQVRTPLQHLWAELMEKLGDLLGRQIRYGAPPNNADKALGIDMTLGDVLDEFRGPFSQRIAEMEVGQDMARSTGKKIRELEAQLVSGQVLDEVDQATFDKTKEEYEAVWSKLVQELRKQERALRATLEVLDWALKENRP